MVVCVWVHRFEETTLVGSTVPLSCVLPASYIRSPGKTLADDPSCAVTERPIGAAFGFPDLIKFHDATLVCWENSD